MILSIEGDISYDEDGLKTIELTNYNIAQKYAFVIINNVEEFSGPTDLIDLIVERMYIPRKSQGKRHMSIVIEDIEDDNS